jgi:membrane protease YdiL (CAAX protease family)
VTHPASPRRILLEAAILTALATGATVLILHAPTARVQHNSGLLIASIWLYLPLLAAWVKKIDFADLGLGRPPVGLSLTLVGLWVLISYPPFYLVWIWAQVHYLGRAFQLGSPPALSNLILVQALAIALPEEFYFRGYLQSRLNLVCGRPWRLWSAQIGPGLFVTALVFMLCHLLVSASWLRVAILFPALLFGWMRERTNSLLAPVLFHALSNLTFIVVQSWLH